jgi:hypothetical protein
MRVFDSHRILGAVPAGRGAETPAGTVADLDHLEIAAAAVTRAWELYGDPRGAEDYLAARGEWEPEPRLIEVPVIVPGPADAGWPAGPGELGAASMVRACPMRHRFDLLGSSALRWWNELVDRNVVLAVDANETGLAGVAALADTVPGLKVLVLSPGYRELRRLRELLDEHRLVHVETGTIVAAGGIEWLARGVGAHRLVFGTGAPVWDDAGPRFQLDHLDLPEHDVALIAHASWDHLVGGSA